MEKTFKHLELIQGTINRLSNNSFLLKGWSVILVSALFALAAGNSNTNFSAIALLPALVFWGLDGYYLWKERSYRALYDQVRQRGEAEIDFSMSTSDVAKERDGWLSATFSETLLPFHGIIVLAIVVVAVFF